MEANAVIWIWNYISFMLHYHFMVVMTVRRWNIYRLFRRHLSNTFPEGHLGLKIHYPFVKLGTGSRVLSQANQNSFSQLVLDASWRFPSPPPTWSILEAKVAQVIGDGTVSSNGPVCEMGTLFLLFLPFMAISGLDHDFGNAFSEMLPAAFHWLFF